MKYFEMPTWCNNVILLMYSYLNMFRVHTPIIRSTGCWLVSIWFSVPSFWMGGGLESRKLMKMDVITFETCWAVKSEIIKQVTSVGLSLFNYPGLSFSTYSRIFFSSEYFHHKSFIRVGASSCNCGDGTDQTVRSLMFMFMFMFMVMVMMKNS